MSYTINHFNGTPIGSGLSVSDGTINNTLDITLIGKNYAGYGQAQNENFIYLLEHFANSTQPPSPIAGQIWYDSSKSKLRFYDGSRFRTAGSAEATPGNQPPSGLSIGDFWFDTTNKQLNVYNGDASNPFTVVGPLTSSTNSGTTQFQIKTVQEQGTATPYTIIQAIVGGSNTVFAISNSGFTLNNTTSAISGYTDIKQGITLNSLSETNGVWSSANYKFWGTASNSDALGGIAASSYVRGDIPSSFTQLINFSDSGYNLGTALNVRNPQYSFFGASAVATPVLEGKVQGIPIVFKTIPSGGSSSVVTMQLLGNTVYPGTSDTTLGTSSHSFNSAFVQTAVLLPSGTAPASATSGMMAVANGTGWNPGADGQEHLMVYLNGAWKKVTTT